LAFEFCRTWLARGARLQHLFVSGAPAPHLYSTTSTALRTDAQLIEMLEEIGLEGVRAMRQDPAFMQVALRTVRADMALVEAYDCADIAALSLPITAFSAGADSFASVASVESWRNYARAAEHFHHYQYAGGHYFIEGERAAILSVLGEVILAHDAEQTVQPRLLRPASDKQRPLAVIVTGGAQTQGDFEPVIRQARAQADLEVLMLALPGHDGGGLPLRRLESMAQVLEQELSVLRSPLILAGHGFPAHVALAVARRRLARGLPVQHLVVSCATAPARYCMPPWRLPACERLLAQQTRDRLRQDPSLEARVDAELSAAFHHRPGPELAGCIDVPVTAIVAADDQVVPPATVPAWRGVTRGPFRLLRVSGGNMYHLSQASALAAALAEAALSLHENFHHQTTGRLS
jgi:surfactin synthase thioesterase subunit